MLIGDCNVCINRKMPPNSAICVECGLSRKNYQPITNVDRDIAEDIVLNTATIIPAEPPKEET